MFLKTFLWSSWPILIMSVPTQEKDICACSNIKRFVSFLHPNLGSYSLNCCFSFSSGVNPAQSTLELPGSGRDYCPCLNIEIKKGFLAKEVRDDKGKIELWMSLTWGGGAGCGMRLGSKGSMQNAAPEPWKCSLRSEVGVELGSESLLQWLVT